MMRENDPIISGVENKAGWTRHTLIWLTPAGRRFAAAHIRDRQRRDGQMESHPPVDRAAVWEERLIQDLLIPGILCRQTGSREGIWTCGFSHWEFADGRRRRLLADFRTEDVEKTLSPFGLCAGKQREFFCREYPKLRGVFSAADCCGLECGIYGSTALEWVTGRPYRHADSDFDLYVRQMPGGDAGRFGRRLDRLEQEMGIHLDVELEMDGYGIKLKELTASGKTVLGKGLYDVRLFEKRAGALIPYEME